MREEVCRWAKAGMVWATRNSSRSCRNHRHLDEFGRHCADSSEAPFAGALPALARLGTEASQVWPGTCRTWADIDRTWPEFDRTATLGQFCPRSGPTCSRSRPRLGRVRHVWARHRPNFARCRAKSLAPSCCPHRRSSHIHWRAHRSRLHPRGSIVLWARDHGQCAPSALGGGWLASDAGGPGTVRARPRTHADRKGVGEGCLALALTCRGRSGTALELVGCEALRGRWCAHRGAPRAPVARPRGAARGPCSGAACGRLDAPLDAGVGAAGAAYRRHVASPPSQRLPCNVVLTGLWGRRRTAVGSRLMLAALPTNVGGHTAPVALGRWMLFHLAPAAV